MENIQFILQQRIAVKIVRDRISIISRDINKNGIRCLLSYTRALYDLDVDYTLHTQLDDADFQPVLAQTLLALTLSAKNCRMNWEFLVKNPKNIISVMKLVYLNASLNTAERANFKKLIANVSSLDDCFQMLSLVNHYQHEKCYPSQLNLFECEEDDGTLCRFIESASVIISENLSASETCIMTRMLKGLRHE